MNLHEFEGPPEPDVFHCGFCNEPILTLWAANHRGMFRGKDHCLMGDQVWHCTCVDTALEKCPI